MFQNETLQYGQLRLVVIADDFTGALDTGVKFAKHGARVRVALADELPSDAHGTEVLVVDAETRHLPPQEAYAATLRLAGWAAARSVPHLYIKTDSALRGNIGAAVKAALDATGSKMAAFAPAYPDMGRITRGGVQWIDGMPLQDSVFSQDLLNPVHISGIGDLFSSWDLGVREYPPGAEIGDLPKEKTVAVFDVETNDDFQLVITQLQARGNLRVTAGCAGFADALHTALGLPCRERPSPYVEGPLLVICGSVNPITKLQLAYGEDMGCVRRTYPLSRLLDEHDLDSLAGQNWLKELQGLFRTRVSVLLDTDGQGPEAGRTAEAEKIGACIAGRLGQLLLRLLDMPETKAYTPMVIGGDTLIGFVRQLKAPSITLEGEVTTGVVAFSVQVNGKRIRMLSKSGGLGKKNILDCVTAQAKYAEG